MKRIVIILMLITFNGSLMKAQTQKNQKMEMMKSTNSITLSAAQQLASKGLEIAKNQSKNLSIAIVDNAGNLLAFVRMDDAAIVTIDVAIQKGKTAAYLKAPSKLFEDFINSGQPSMLSTPGISSLQGGVPITYKDQIIGAVGVSGADGETDNAIATAIAQLDL